MRETGLFWFMVGIAALTYTVSEGKKLFVAGCNHLDAKRQADPRDGYAEINPGGSAQPR